MKRTILKALGSVLLIDFSTCLAEEPNKTPIAIIRNTAVELFSDNILLLRKDETICAVRFFRNKANNRLEHTESYATPNVSTPGTTYECHCDSMSNKSATFSPSYHKQGYLRLGVRIGIGRAQIAIGENDEVVCDTFTAMWSPPTKLNYFTLQDGNFTWDPKLEIAPTGWKDLKEVRIINPKVIWFRAGTTQKEINFYQPDSTQ